MNYPATEFLGTAIDPKGLEYSLHFYGEAECSAVITGPRGPADGRFHMLPEVYSEPAEDVADARAKLAVWCRDNGWHI